MLYTDKALSALVSHAGVQEEEQVFALLLHTQNVNSAKSATVTP